MGEPSRDKRAVSIRRVPYQPEAWAAVLEAGPDAEVFHSPEWIRFLVTSQGAEPVIAEVCRGERVIGHFVGAVVRVFGLRILGSPLRGWTTPYMGFLMDDDADRPAAAAALLDFAFRELRCVHVELVDRRLTGAQMNGSPYRVETPPTFVIDLRCTEDDLLRRVQPRTRTYIRKASREGLWAEPAHAQTFAEEYHQQLRSVFARQGLSPTYGPERVRQLIRSLQPSGLIYLLRVCGPGGRCVATSVTVGRGETAYVWGVASLRDEGAAHASQLLWWEGIRYWRNRGAIRYDMGGAGDYKAAYGGVKTTAYRFYASRFDSLDLARRAVRRVVRWRQRASHAADRTRDR